MMKNTTIVMKASKKLNDACDAIEKKLKASRAKRQKHMTKKATEITVTIPKGCHLEETTKRIREYVKEVLAKDCDWDYAFLIYLIRYKLQRMQKCILKNNIIADAKKICDQMKEVEDALTRIEKDDYLLPKIDALQKKYEVKSGTIKRPDGMYQLATLPRKKGGTFDEKKYDKEHKEACKQAEAERQKDLEIAFGGMQRNVLSWWE
jgi:hypothetical protein